MRPVATAQFMASFAQSATEALCDHDIPNRIAPAPRATDGKAACGMALLIHPDDIEAARTCIEENNAEYVSIVPLENQLHKKRDRYC